MEEDYQKDLIVENKVEQKFLQLENDLEEFDFFYPNTDDGRVFKEWSLKQDQIENKIIECSVIDFKRTEATVKSFQKEFGVDLLRCIK